MSVAVRLHERVHRRLRPSGWWLLVAACGTFLVLRRGQPASEPAYWLQLGTAGESLLWWSGPTLLMLVAAADGGDLPPLRWLLGRLERLVLPTFALHAVLPGQPLPASAGAVHMRSVRRLLLPDPRGVLPG